MTHLKIAGAPYLFLKQFPDWKTSHETHMIPPIFTIKNKSTHQIGIKGSAPIIDKGDQGEAIIFDLLIKFGESNKVGMFVVRRFELKDLTRWKKNTGGCQDFIKKKDGEFDFIIFHHTLGIISLEVKNYSKAESSIPNAMLQLETSKQVVMKFGTYNSKEEHVSIPHKKVFAMPFTKKNEFNNTSVDNDVVLLFEENCQNVEAFHEWWQREFEYPTSQLLTPQTQEAYETAMSYTLIIRHLSPVNETDQVASIFNEFLNHYSCHRDSAYTLILRDNYSNFWTWCLDVTSKMYENYNFGDEDPEDVKETFIQSHFGMIKTGEKALIRMTGVKCINNLLMGKCFISGPEPCKLDEVLVSLYLKKYLLFFENTLRFINAIRKVPLLVEHGPISDPTLIEKFPFLKLESCEDFNMLDMFLSKSSFLLGDKPTRIFSSLKCSVVVV